MKWLKGKSELLLTSMTIMAKFGFKSNQKAVEARYALNALRISTIRFLGSRHYIILKS
jgi:hypothetical protein